MTYKKFLYELLEKYIYAYNILEINQEKLNDGTYVYTFEFSNNFKCYFKTEFFVEAFCEYQTGISSFEDLLTMMHQTTLTLFCLDRELINKEKYWRE